MTGFYVSNANSSVSPTTFANQCSKRIRTTKAKKQMVILANAVQYGVTDKACNSIEDCTKKCLKVKSELFLWAFWTSLNTLPDCVGFSISTEDGEGVTKLQVLDAKLGYAFNFNSGMCVPFVSTRSTLTLVQRSEHHQQAVRRPTGRHPRLSQGPNHGFRLPRLRRPAGMPPADKLEEASTRFGRTSWTHRIRIFRSRTLPHTQEPKGSRASLFCIFNQAFL
jgi:hypothetical protein